MGVLADLLASSASFSTDDAADSTIIRFLKSNPVDPALPANKAATNAVVTVTANGETVGNFTLTITVGLNAPFTTANIAYNANAATIEGAIDTAATAAALPGWTNGDISVACASTADLADVIMTFDGTSVAGTRCTASSGGDFTPTVTETTAGQSDRPALGALKALGVVEITTKQYATPVANDFTILTTPASNPNYPPPAVIEALLKEAGYQDRGNYFGWFRYTVGVGPLPS